MSAGDADVETIRIEDIGQSSNAKNGMDNTREREEDSTSDSEYEDCDVDCDDDMCPQWCSQIDYLGQLSGAKKYTNDSLNETTRLVAESSDAIKSWQRLDVDQRDQLAIALRAFDGAAPQPEPEIPHATSASGRGNHTLMEIVEQGLGSCVQSLVEVRPDMVKSALSISRHVQSTHATELSTADVDAMQMDVAAARLFSNLLADTGVQNIGVVPVAALREDAITEVNLLGQEWGPCEASLLAHFFDHNKALDRILVNDKLTVTKADCTKTTLDFSKKELGPRHIMLLAALLSTESMAGLDEVDISGNMPVGRISRDNDGMAPWLPGKDMSGWRELCTSLAGSKVKSVKAANCELGPEPISALASTLAGVETVDLSNNRFDPSLLDGIKHKVKLDLAGCRA